MDWKTYEIKAMRTQADQQVILDRLHGPAPYGKDAMRLIIGVMGLSDEVGELNGATKSFIEYGKPLDVINVKEEIGDCLWRLAQICAAVGISLEECAEANITKLAIRYPEKFTDHSAAEENRDREAERKTLEGQQCGHSVVEWLTDTLGQCVQCKTKIPIIVTTERASDGSEIKVAQQLPTLSKCPTCCVPTGAVHLENCPEPARVAKRLGLDNQSDELPPLDLTKPRITVPENYEPHDYDGTCKTCKKPVHHTNKTGYCANCYNRAKEAGLY